MLKKFSLNKQKMLKEIYGIFDFQALQVQFLESDFEGAILKCIFWGSNFFIKAFEMYFLREQFLKIYFWGSNLREQFLKILW